MLNGKISLVHINNAQIAEPNDKGFELSYDSK